jgi:hypothetical protein
MKRDLKLKVWVVPTSFPKLSAGRWTLVVQHDIQK